MAPLSSVSGLASGIDFQALADAIIAARRAPIRALESQITGHERRSQAYLSLESRLRAVQEAARVLASASDLVRESASVVVPPGVAATYGAVARPGASLGATDVVVLQVAASERLGGAEFVDRSAPLGLEGGFQVNGRALEAGPLDTLDDLVRRINDAEAGVRAATIQVSPGTYTLVLSSLEEGAGGIHLDDGGGVLEGLGLLTATGEKARVLKAGADARILVEGVEVTRSSNVVDDVLDGVTLTLLRADPDVTGRLEVSRDTTPLRSAIEGLVEAYNGVARFARSQVSSTEGERPVLSGDPVLRSLATALQEAMTATPGGRAGAVPGRLGDLGVSLQVDGTLAIDGVRLGMALQDRPDAVARLFELEWSSSSPGVTLLGTGAGTLDGTYRVEVTALATRAVAQGVPLGDPVTGVTEGDVVRMGLLDGTAWVEVTLEEGMTPEMLVARLAEAARDLGLELDITLPGSAIRIEHAHAGSGLGFQLEFGGNAAGLTGLEAGEFRGTDVEGMVDGQVAVGRGDLLLVGASGPAQGLALRVDALPPGGEAVVTVNGGIGVRVQGIAGRATGTGEASLRAVQDRLREGVDRMRSRTQTIAARLDGERERLYRRFAAVEEAIARAQTRGTYLTSQLDQISRFQYASRRR